MKNFLTPGGYYVLRQEGGRSSVQSRGRVHYQRRPGGICHFYYYFTGRWCYFLLVCLFCIVFQLEDFSYDNRFVETKKYAITELYN